MSGRRRSGVRSGAGRNIDWLLVLSVILIVVSSTLGGDSARNDLQLMVIELTALPLLALTAWRTFQPGAPRHGWPVLALLGAVLVLPLVQLIPLPPPAWQALPGRELATASLGLAGAAGDWRPLSLTPEATWRAFLWLMPPTALFLAMPHLDQRARLMVMVAVLTMTFLSLVVGALQLIGVGFLQFYAHGDQNQASGLFWNRNHQATAMAISLPLAAAVIVSWRDRGVERRKLALAVFIALMGLYVVGALATLSRAGLILSGAGLVGALVIFYQAQRRASGERRQTALVIGAVVLVVALTAGVGLSPVLARFDRAGGAEARFQSWPTIAATAGHYLPAGTGLGAFGPVYRSVEPPQTVTDTYVVAAHSDFLQVWLEGGAGSVLVFASLVWLGYTGIQIWKASFSKNDVLHRGASLTAWILVAHSIADYPLRTPMLACFLALLCGSVARFKWTPS